jgi:hypothetical protein
MLKRGLCACKTGCKPVVCFPIEEMSQETCEGCCEHSLKQLIVHGRDFPSQLSALEGPEK